MSIIVVISLGKFAHLTPSGVLGPHLRTPNPGFNPEFTLGICYINGGVNPGLNTEFGVLRCGPWSVKHVLASRIVNILKQP
jgi:hypothetical protein